MNAEIESPEVGMKRIFFWRRAFVSLLVCVVLPLEFVRANTTYGDAEKTAGTLARTSAQAAPLGGDADDPRFAKFVYEIVSIKPYKEYPNATSRWMGSQDSPDGFTMHNAPLTILIGQAYRTEHSKTAGAPDWMNNDRYDVEAKMEPEVTDAFQTLSAADQKLARQHMLRVLVRDYLKVSFHIETTQVSIYELVVGKNGSKLKESADPKASDAGMRCTGGAAMTCVGKSLPVTSLLGQISFGVGRPVYDKTGLTGKYDFTLKFTPDRPGSAGPDVAAPPEEAPTIAIAVEEQLGLKLIPAKGAMDVIVIDHVERPSAN